MIEAPPPPPLPDRSEWARVDLAVIDTGIGIPISDVIISDLFAVGTTATMISKAPLTFEAADEPVALTGVPATLPATQAGGYLLDTP